jgi:hypothetical protein
VIRPRRAASCPAWNTGGVKEPPSQTPRLPLTAADGVELTIPGIVPERRRC